MYDEDMIKRFQPIDVDNIFAASYIGYWAKTVDTIRLDDQYKTIESFRIQEIETSKTAWITADSLVNATNDVLAGKHVGKYLRDMCIKDVQEWEDDPTYGVPFDAELSDCLIQIAMFGTLVYG